MFAHLVSSVAAATAGLAGGGGQGRRAHHPPSSGPLSRALGFHHEDAELSAPSPQRSLHVKHSAGPFAVRLRIVFISYLSEAFALFKTGCTRGERSGGEGLETAFPAFLANSQSWPNGALKEQEAEERS